MMTCTTIMSTSFWHDQIVGASDIFTLRNDSVDNGFIDLFDPILYMLAFGSNIRMLSSRLSFGRQIIQISRVQYIFYFSHDTLVEDVIRTGLFLSS